MKFKLVFFYNMVENKELNLIGNKFIDHWELIRNLCGNLFVDFETPLL